MPQLSKQLLHIMEQQKDGLKIDTDNRGKQKFLGLGKSYILNTKQVGSKAGVARTVLITGFPILKEKNNQQESVHLLHTSTFYYLLIFDSDF